MLQPKKKRQPGCRTPYTFSINITEEGFNYIGIMNGNAPAGSSRRLDSRLAACARAPTVDCWNIHGYQRNLPEETSVWNCRAPDLPYECLADPGGRVPLALASLGCFSNHYHFVAASEQPASLKRFIQYLHSISAKYVNREDNASGRTAWFQYWDTHLTCPKSFLSRLNYVHTNAVRHGLVRIPEQYPWCSAGWFVQRASPAFRETVMHFPSDKINVPDNFDVVRPA